MATINRRRKTAPVTHEGAPAARLTPEQELRRSVLACLLWEDTFYEEGEAIADRIARLVAAVPLETAAEIAIEARERQHIRHAPLLIVREMARRGGRIVGDTLARVIQRPDELTEFLAIYWREGRRPLSKQVKRGLALAFPKFDAYQLAKYDRPKAVRLRDVLFLCHAKPRDEEQAAVWRQLVEGTLPPADTWEVALSRGDDPYETWTRLLVERKLGGLALLRNLRNMLAAGVDLDLIRQAIEEHQFERVLPFRFIAAARYAPKLEPVLEAAMFRALQGVPRLPGKTVLVIDHSGSMNVPLSSRSELRRFDAATGLAILLREICEELDMIAFSSDAALVPPRHGFALADAIEKATGWGGTLTEKAKRLADSLGYDRIIIVTDEQSHQALSAPQGKGYVINVAPYQNGVGYGPWVHIDGWSEAVVRWIAEYERL